MNMGWFLRMAQWVRHPPSPQRVKLVLGVIAVVALIYGLEQLFGWPEALTPDRARVPKF